MGKKKSQSDDYLDIRVWLKDANDLKIKSMMTNVFRRDMPDYANEHWHGTGWRLRSGDTPIHEIIPADYWKFLQYDERIRKASGGGIEYVAVEIHAGPPDGSLQNQLRSIAATR